MKQIHGTTEFHIEEDTVLTLGKFDGIHRGHELLMERLAAKKEDGMAAAVFTFDVPPQRVVARMESCEPSACEDFASDAPRADGVADAKSSEQPSHQASAGDKSGVGIGSYEPASDMRKDVTQGVKLLTTNEEKAYMREGMGIDYLVVCPFTDEVMHMEAEDFLERVVTGLRVKCMVVGSDFRFGHNRRGDVDMLRAMADIYEYELVVIDKIKEDSRDISSTFVREEIARGNIEKANRLLGYRYFVAGRVMPGRHIGSRIGIPTINQQPSPEKLLPPNGVYLTEVFVDGRKYRGVTNVGIKPTVGEGNPIGVETHLLDFADDIYGRAVTVEFLTRVRGERKFTDVEALREQLLCDIAYGRNYFSTRNMP